MTLFLGLLRRTQLLSATCPPRLRPGPLPRDAPVPPRPPARRRRPLLLDATLSGIDLQLPALGTFLSDP